MRPEFVGHTDSDGLVTSSCSYLLFVLCDVSHLCYYAMDVNTGWLFRAKVLVLHNLYGLFLEGTFQVTNDHLHIFSSSSRIPVIRFYITCAFGK